MAELETRIISGKGLLRVNKDTLEFEKGRVFTLYASVIRKPFNEFLNFNYNPPRSRYATLVFLRDGHVIDTRSMEYPDQAWDFHLDPAAQVLYAVKCSYAGILATFVNLGNALSLVPISVTNNIEDWFHIDLMWDEVKVVCYADTAIRLRLESADYDLCPDDATPAPKPPPPPPGTAPEVPPGTPLEETSTPASEAYDGENDSGDTEPLPGDATLPPPDPLEPPIGEDGEFYSISFTYDRIRPAGVVFDTQTVTFANCRAVIQDYGISDDMTAFGSAAPGAYVIGTNPDGSPLYYTNGLGFPGFSTSANLRDISITLV